MEQRIRRSDQIQTYCTECSVKRYPVDHDCSIALLVCCVTGTARTTRPRRYHALAHVKMVGKRCSMNERAIAGSTLPRSSGMTLADVEFALEIRTSKSTLEEVDTTNASMESLHSKVWWPFGYLTCGPGICGPERSVVLSFWKPPDAFTMPRPNFWNRELRFMVAELPALVVTPQ